MLEKFEQKQLAERRRAEHWRTIAESGNDHRRTPRSIAVFPRSRREPRRFIVEYNERLIPRPANIGARPRADKDFCRLRSQASRGKRSRTMRERRRLLFPYGRYGFTVRNLGTLIGYLDLGFVTSDFVFARLGTVVAWT